MDGNIGFKLKLNKRNSNIGEEIESLLTAVEANKGIQGHICINNSSIFDTSIRRGVYGYTGSKNTSLNVSPVAKSVFCFNVADLFCAVTDTVNNIAIIIKTNFTTNR